MSKCGGCDNKLGNQNDWVTCGKCKNKYHYECSNVSLNTWRAKGQKKRDQWKCKKCRKQRTPSEKETDRNEQEDEESSSEDENENTDKIEGKEEEEEEINIEDVRAMMRRIEKKLDKLMDAHEKFIEITAKVTELEKTIDFLDKENKDTKEENKEMKIKMKDMEERLFKLENSEANGKEIEKKIQELTLDAKEKDQYERNRNLEINQLDWLPNENIREVVQRVADKFNIKSFKHEQIEAGHRIPNRNKTKPSVIILQFKHREFRDAWLATRKKIVTNNDIYSNDHGNRIYLNENMSPFYKNLFWKAKSFAKENNIKYVWFMRGKIMMRKDETHEEVKWVRSEEDLKL